jgi:hypothetical protein
MNFHETLYLRDDETDEFGDSGAYGESLEEDYEEEEEEEEAELPGVTDAGAEPPMPATPVPVGGAVVARPKQKRKSRTKKRSKQKNSYQKERQKESAQKGG